LPLSVAAVAAVAPWQLTTIARNRKSPNPNSNPNVYAPTSQRHWHKSFAD